MCHVPAFSLLIDVYKQNGNIDLFLLEYSKLYLWGPFVSLYLYAVNLSVFGTKTIHQIPNVQTPITMILIVNHIFSSSMGFKPNVLI